MLLDYIHADPPKSLPPIPVRVSRRSQLTAALHQHARPIVIEDQELEHVPPQLNQGDSRGAEDGRVYRH